MSLPTPRSFNTILADMLDSFLSRTGLRRFKVGGPLLSIFESVAQNMTRSTQDVFNMLDSISIDRADGSILDRLAADEGISRQTLTPSSGFVNFLDTSFTKIASALYQGSAAPNAGANSIRVSDASQFPSTGSIFIGRNTSNYEGPIAYSSKADNGSYWTLTLSSPTTKFHNLNESVILAQGSTRTIPAGTIVQTPQGNVSNAIKFSTLYSTQIEDGETIVENVEVIANEPGIIGNIPAETINEVLNPPYVGAFAVNPLPFTNGQAAESDESLRERIRNSRQTKQKGTVLAINNGILGVSSQEDSKTVVSSSIINANTDLAALFIDDGTGYEESTSGIPTETLIDSALGGEQFFQLSSQRPVAKAFIKTTVSEPFNLSPGMVLSVNVGNQFSEHNFDESEFRSISNASAFEVVASINGNPDLLFSARTSDSGKRVAIFAKSETLEDIQVIEPAIGNDSNAILKFPTELNYTIRLFKNDELLYKDGKLAIVESNSQSDWSASIVSGDTLEIQVDGTATQTVTILDSDFIDTNLGFTTVNASNSLESWSEVLNSKVAGATFSPSSGRLLVESNLGLNDRASITIIGGTLVSKGMFTAAATDSGRTSDFVLNRNSGQLKLLEPLVEGDNLTAGTEATRAYIQSQEIPSASITLSSTANLWLIVDGQAQKLETAISSNTSIAITNPSGDIARYTAPNNTFGTSLNPFIAIGDWVIIWDTNFTDKGMFIVSDIDTTNYSWFEIQSDGVVVESAQPTNNGIVFVRSKKPVQNIQVSSGTYSLTALVADLNSKLIGASSSLFRNTKYRINTNTYGDNGDIMLITADLQGQLLQLPVGTLKINNPNHFPVVESGNSEVGTPKFKVTTVDTGGTGTFTLVDAVEDIFLRSGDLITFRKTIDQIANNYYGNSVYNSELLESATANTVVVRTNAKTNEKEVDNRVFASSSYGITAQDNLSIILDQDEVNKDFNINLFRNIKPHGSSTYGATAFEVLDVDNSNLSLNSAFGTTSTLFNDFALYMKARGKSHSITANKAILWRYNRYGSEGNYAAVSFINPSAPNSDFAVSSDFDFGGVQPKANVKIALKSGAARTGLNLNSVNYFFSSANKLYSAISTTRAANVVTVTLAAAGTTNVHALQVGDMVYQTTDETGGPTFRKGPKAVTAVTANTFSYAETGANESSAHLYLTSKKPAGIKYTATALSSSGTHITATIGAHVFQVGDYVYFEPGHFDPTSGITITAGGKNITSIAATTVTWAETATAGSATLISGVTYTVSSGNGQRNYVGFFKAEIGVGNLSRNGSGVVTAIMNTTPLITAHPFKVNDIIYLSPGEVDFPSGSKIVTEITGTTFKYRESGAAVSSTAIQYFSSTSSDIDFSTVLTGDIVHIDSASGFDEEMFGDFRVKDIATTSFTFLKVSDGYAGNSVPTKLNGANYLQFYPIETSGSTASDIVTWVNANASQFVTATLVPHNGSGATTGAATISVATLDEFLTSTNNASLNGTGTISVDSWSLFDGLNYVKTTNIDGSNSKISLKNAVSGELTANANFSAENMRLVPITVNGFKNFLSSTAISGFISNGLINSSTDSHKLQLGSLKLGSEGSIEVSGGTGNLATFDVVGTIPDSIIVESRFKSLNSQLNGFTGGMSVKVEAANKVEKQSPNINGATTVEITSGTNPNEWFINFSSAIIDLLVDDGLASTFQIEKHGKFVAYVDISVLPISLATVKAGDWALIDCDAMSVSNNGLKRIVAVDSANNTFWVEDDGAVEEIVTMDGVTDTLRIYSYDSALIGDTLIINTDVLGSQNVGEFQIVAMNGSDTSSFYVTGTMSAVSPTALGSDYNLVKIKEGSPHRFYGTVEAIHQDSDDLNYSSVMIYNLQYPQKVSEAAGSVVYALDKLEFPTNITLGLDSYSYNTGLLSEVNRVVYGDETNPATYPGIAAANANIVISGPLIKRVEISLAVRLRTGVVAQDTISSIKSAVATVINSSKIGESIAISDVVSAANSVTGVLSVSVLSPIYTSSNDLIPVQSNEKPKVLDLDTDISVSILT